MVEFPSDDETPSYLSLLNDFEVCRRNIRKRIASGLLAHLSLVDDPTTWGTLKMILHGELDVIAQISPEIEEKRVLERFLQELQYTLAELKVILKRNEPHDGYLDMFSSN